MGRRCETCGRLNPVMSQGPGPGVDPTNGFRLIPGKPFTYIESALCMSCRHAPVLPGRLGRAPR